MRNKQTAANTTREITITLFILVSYEVARFKHEVQNRLLILKVSGLQVQTSLWGRERPRRQKKAFNDQTN
jgi:hypothetical protein